MTKEQIILTIVLLFMVSLQTWNFTDIDKLKHKIKRLNQRIIDLEKENIERAEKDSKG